MSVSTLKRRLGLSDDIDERRAKRRKPGERVRCGWCLVGRCGRCSKTVGRQKCQCRHLAEVAPLERR